MVMLSLEIDTSEKGLRSVLRDYQEIALRVIWESQEGLNSRAVWERVNHRLKAASISRASIINFLEGMREMGVLRGTDKTGKGGHQWVYSPAMSESGFKVFVASTVLGILRRDFPKETEAALEKLAL